MKKLLADFICLLHLLVVGFLLTFFIFQKWKTEVIFAVVIILIMQRVNNGDCILTSIEWRLRGYRFSRVSWGVYYLKKLFDIKVSEKAYFWFFAIWIFMQIILLVIF